MSSWAEVRRLALALPETVERSSRDGLASWTVRDLMFAWERPLRRADLAALGDDAPEGPILGLRTADLDTKEALLAEHAPAFTTPHFDGYPAVLVSLGRIDLEDLHELIVQAWLARAPKRLAEEFLATM